MGHSSATRTRVPMITPSAPKLKRARNPRPSATPPPPPPPDDRHFQGIHDPWYEAKSGDIQNSGGSAVFIPHYSHGIGPDGLGLQSVTHPHTLVQESDALILQILGKLLRGPVARSLHNPDSLLKDDFQILPVVHGPPCRKQVQIDGERLIRHSPKLFQL